MPGIINFLKSCEEILWSSQGLFIILSIGMALSIRSGFFQFKILGNPKKYIGKLLESSKGTEIGVHPIRLYFSSVGGMVGLGNLVIVVTVLTYGGPAAIIWMWIASFLGMVIKYSEIYLGIKYRVPYKSGYDGGPMQFLSIAYKNSRLKLDKILPIVVAILLWIYGAEIVQFAILADQISVSFNQPKEVVVAILLVMVLLSTFKEVQSLSIICSILMPIFMISYLIICLWIVFNNYSLVPAFFKEVFYDFFTLKGGVTGVLAAAQAGMSRAVYSGDIGIGYDSIVQSETKSKNPEDQARLAIFALASDTFICTCTLIIIYLSGVYSIKNLELSQYIISALRKYLPFADLYLTFAFFAAGFTTLIGFLVMGQKAARFLHPKYGKLLYFLYSVVAFIFFAFQKQETALLIMSISSGLLVVINLSGIFLLRKEIKFVK